MRSTHLRKFFDRSLVDYQTTKPKIHQSIKLTRATTTKKKKARKNRSYQITTEFEFKSILEKYYK